jgi:hypothetical protein
MADRHRDARGQDLTAFDVARLQVLEIARQAVQANAVQKMRVSHEYHHRHFMGKVEPVEFDNYKALAERFQAEVIELWNEEERK